MRVWDCQDGTCLGKVPLPAAMHSERTGEGLLGFGTVKATVLTQAGLHVPVVRACWGLVVRACWGLVVRACWGLVGQLGWLAGWLLSSQGQRVHCPYTRCCTEP